MLFSRFFTGDSVEPVLFVVGSLTIDFLGEVNWPSVVKIGTGVLRIGRTSCSIGHGLFVSGQCVATSESTIVLIDEFTRKPKVIPEWIRNWFNGFLIPENVERPASIT